MWMFGIELERRTTGSPCSGSMQAAVILTAATVTLALDNVASAGTVQCEADHECESGYCYRDSGYCGPCTDCGHYLRKKLPWRNCARKPEDCGSCLPDYEYVYLTDGSVGRFCVPKSPSANDVLNERSQYIWVTSICVGMVMLLILFYLIFRAYRAYKTRLDDHNSNPDAEDPPPPPLNNVMDHPPPSYDSSVPLLNNSVVSSVMQNSLTVVEKEGSNSQLAVPYTYPGCSNGNGEISDVNDEDPDVAEYLPEENSPGSPFSDVIHRLSPPRLEDEDTLPSMWSPFAYSIRHSPETSNFPFSQTNDPNCDEHSSPRSQHSSVASSSSDISMGDDVDDEDVRASEVLNDSGVSASCSHQSNLSSAAEAEPHSSLLASGPNSSLNPLRNVLERCCSEEDVNAEIRVSKKARYDSGSSSMKSLEPY